MTTNAPISPVTNSLQMLPLSALYKPARGLRTGGYDVLHKMIKDGRRVTREQRLRWQENREFYRGNQNVYTVAGESQLRGELSGISQRSKYNPYNRLRQFTDGRTALMTKVVPPYQVIPENRDQDSRDGARQAEKFIDSRWGANGWNIAETVAELFANADIDGISWLSVLWDPEAAESYDQLIGVDANGEPIRDPAVYAALKAEDPTASTLWSMVRSKTPLGDVCWRVVLPGAMSVDPMAIKNPRDAKWVCESRIQPISSVEKRLGMSLKDAVRASSQVLSEKFDFQYEDIATDDGGSLGHSVSGSEYTVVHYFYARPSTDFPKGAHIEMCDKAPGRPMLVEEWEDELPYHCLINRPDPGHFLRSKGIVDDLKPIQRDYNSTLNNLREWLRRVAKTPVAIPFGSMASESYFNEEGFFFYHPQMGEPHHSNVPAEPTAVLTNDLARMVAEMRDISGVSASSQGLRAPGGPEAAVGLNIEIQQTESNLSRAERRLKTAIEWGVSRSLKMVERHYSVARSVTGVGVDDSEEFAAFQGAMLRGSHRFTITGSLMPKSKAARMAAIQQMIPVLGPKITPFLGSLIDGDTDALTRDLEVDSLQQRGENRELLGLSTQPKAVLVYKNFEDDKMAFSEAFNVAVQSGEQDPINALAQRGIRPPNLTQSLLAAGFNVPMVEDFHDHALELKALNDFRKADGYRRLSPMSKQLLREHADQHTAELGKQIAAMAEQSPMGQQQGSAPRETGTASQPKNGPPSPGGM